MKNKANLVAAVLLLGAIAFNLVFLWPEVAVETPPLNDTALHLPLVQRAAEAFARGEDPTDPWVPYFVEGYPLFHHYQHLPHVVTALLYELLQQLLSAGTVFNWVRYLLLCTFPLSIYWAGRRLGFGPRPAALTGVVSSLLATNGLFGLEMGSYIWRGSGLFTQLWGMWLLPPALAGIYVTVREGKGYAGTAVLVAATLLSHTVLGYIALLSGGLFVFLDGWAPAGRRLLRLLLLFTLVALLASYFLVPFLQDRLYMNRSVWEDPGKYDAYGWEWTLSALAKGDLLDYGRFPSLTILAALGLIISFLHWREERYRFAVVLFLAWLLLYFGRPTWGILLELLPLGHDLHLHRLIAGVHVGAIGLIGVGLGWLWERALAMRRRWPFIAVAVLTAALLGPVYYERADYLLENGRWMRENAAAFAADEGALDRLLADLQQAPPGRVYAGRAANWGEGYRIGSVPVYALLPSHGFDSPGYLYHALSLNADIEGYLDENRFATFDLFNLRYVIVPEGQPAPTFAQFVAAYGRHQLYTVETTGYFALVDSDVTLYGEVGDWFVAARAWLSSPLVEAKQQPQMVLGTRPAGDGLAAPFAEAPAALPALPIPSYQEACGLVLNEGLAGNRYAVDFYAERPCWLMLKETYHPGWQVTLDDQPAATAMLAPSFVGIPVEPGRHQAVFHYEPGPLRGVLRIVGLVALLLGIVLEWQRARWSAWLKQLAAPLGRAQAALALAWGQLAAVLRAGWEKEWKWLAILFLFILLAGLPTLQLKQMSGHDALEYLPRAVEFYTGLEEGRILPGWAPDLSMGYGQPFFLFNPPVIYYLAALFHALGTSLVVALDLACLALLLLAGLGMYLFARELYGRPGGAVAGAAYVLAPFMLVNLYVRYALADYAAMAWIPWACWGLLRWSFVGRTGPVEHRYGNARYLFVAAAAVALLMLSSNPVALLVVPVLGLYVLFLAGRSRRWATLARGLTALVLGLALSAFFWLPTLLERNWVQVGNLLSGYLNYANHFVYLHQFLYSKWGYGLSLPGPQDGMSFGLGLAHLLLLVAGIVLARVMRAQLRELGEGWAHFWFFIWVLVLTLVLATDNSIALWNALPLLQYLEFPWRVLVLAAFATAVIAALPVLAVRPPRRHWLLAVVFLALLFTGMPRAHPETYYAIEDADYAPGVIAASGIAVTTTREYEPIWALEQPPQPAPAGRLLLVSGQMRVLESTVAGMHYDWLIEANGPVQLRIATFYYPAWQLTVDGEPRPLTVQNNYGLMDFFLEDGVHRVQVTFGLTPLRGVGVGVSLVGVLLLVVAASFWRRKRR
jgi:4-amino-4-deoxy-L-arabinose transferase-like glycosyltransferase